MKADRHSVHKQDLPGVYGRAEALEVVSRSLADYQERFGDLESILTGALEIAR